MHLISLVIADRNPLFLRGLTKLLRAESGFQVVATCSDGPSCIEAIRHFRPDLALLDTSMPGLTGLDILIIANSENLSTRVVFLPGSIGDRELALAVAEGKGAYGVILKDVTPDILVQSLRQVARGQRLLPLSAAADEAEAQERARIAITEDVLTVLTDRERQIMGLVSQGLSNKEMGRRLNITDGTIKVHIHNIFQKLEISNRTVLAALAKSQR